MDMTVVDDTMSKLHPTIRAILALVAAATFGALGATGFQSYIGVPAQIKEDREAQAVRDSLQDRRIATVELEARNLEARIEGANLSRLVDTVEELVFQLCVDRIEREGALTARASRDCRDRADHPGGS